MGREALGRVREEGDRFELAGHSFEVVDMDGWRVDKGLVTPARGGGAEGASSAGPAARRPGARPGGLGGGRWACRRGAGGGAAGGRGRRGVVGSAARAVFWRTSPHRMDPY